jgi:hypothetical protein
MLGFGYNLTSYLKQQFAKTPVQHTLPSNYAPLKTLSSHSSQVHPYTHTLRLAIHNVTNINQ